MRNKISTLSCPNLTDARRDGNTTRQINFGIDCLFKGYDVKFSDHYKQGQDNNANDNLYCNTLKILSFEYDLEHLKKSFEFDKFTNTITWNK